MVKLAQYSIRSKQEYIFRTNAMRQIQGGSALISKAWDMLIDSAKSVGLKVKELNELDDSFPTDPNAAFEGGYDMVDLFRGGGNDTVLFRDENAFRVANGAFTRTLLEKAPGMIPMCVGVDATLDYRKDWENLMKESEKIKNSMMPGRSIAMMPFSQMDRKTFQPIVTASGTELSAEALAKQDASKGDTSITKENRMLDDMLKKNDSKSLLAVIHADGNNMGAKIIKLLGEENDYSVCIPLMRKFTRCTAQAFTGDEVVSRIEKLGHKLRWIIKDGDDVTLVCDAHDAEKIAVEYLKAVSEQQADIGGKKFNYNSCAGICIFHSHFPFSTAYALAEDACRNAKRKVHGTGDDGIIEESWLDYHFIHYGVGGDLQKIRLEHGTDSRMARPLGVCCKESECFTVDRIKEFRRIVYEGELSISRSNLKTISAEWERDMNEGLADMERVYFRTPGLREALTDLFVTDGNILKAIYDLTEVYDIEWFKDEVDEK